VIFTTLLWRADDGLRSVVLEVMDLLATFFVQADEDKDRRPAAATFEKKFKRLARGSLKEVDDAIIEALLDQIQIVLNPPYQKYKEKPKAASRTPTRVASPTYYHQPQQAMYASPTRPHEQQAMYASPSQPACPPGFQLTAIAAAPARASPPGGGRPIQPSCGIAATKPGEIFPSSHFTRPCTYCAHAGHAGDTCWKTYPELRQLNGHK
jgi:hypothetical protein